VKASFKNALTACVSIIQTHAIPRKMSMKVSLCDAMLFASSNNGKFAIDFNQLGIADKDSENQFREISRDLIRREQTNVQKCNEDTNIYNTIYSIAWLDEYFNDHAFAIARNFSKT
jgi:hypothetical protein